MNFHFKKFTICLQFQNSARPNRSRAAAIGFGSLAAISFRILSLLDFLSSNKIFPCGHLSGYRACAKGKPLRLPYYMHQVKTFVKPWLARPSRHPQYYIISNRARPQRIPHYAFVYWSIDALSHYSVCYWSKAIT